MKNIERDLKIQLRKLNGEDFGAWLRNLTIEQQTIFNKMWERDSKTIHKPTYRIL